MFHESVVERKGFLKVDLSIILPTLNEVESVPVSLSYLEKLLEAVDFELIVVDDDSTDGTWQKVLEISRNNPRVRLIRRVHRKGLSKEQVLEKIILPIFTRIFHKSF